uniref:Uncharacterized protein n=1 Tax=Arundo donax TaxID=35708 RepID=A0A0A9G0Q6_ARUDO
MRGGEWGAWWGRGGTGTGTAGACRRPAAARSRRRWKERTCRPSTAAAAREWGLGGEQGGGWWLREGEGGGGRG